MQDESKKVAATNNILPFVSFPGFEIKDLFVHDGVAATQESSNDSNVAEQTQVASVPPPTAPTNSKTSSAPPIPPSDNSSSSIKKSEQQVHPHSNIDTRRSGDRGSGRGRGNTDNNRQPQQARSIPSQASRSSAGTGEHLLKLRVKKVGGGDAPESVVGEFDFEKMLTGFNKKIELDKVADVNQGNDAVKAKQLSYKKEDFFDTLSCDMLDKEEGRKTRMTASEERNLNQDTFGAIAVQQNFRRRGGGYDGYHGRGGRGGRGAGRGYYRGRGRGRGGNGGHAGRVSQDAV